MRHRYYIIGILALCYDIKIASANSYLEMITQAPQNTTEQQIESSYFDGIENSAPKAAPLWYDTHITTPAPVVFSDVTKYQAWQQAKAHENEIQFNPHEFIQNLIYTTEGGLAALGIYQLYKYH